MDNNKKKEVEILKLKDLINKTSYIKFIKL